MKLTLDKIDYDPQFYPRVNGSPDWLTVLRYSETLQTKPKLEFDPVHVVRALCNSAPFMLIDGLHRLRAYLQAGRKEIPVVEERIPKSKWFQRSVELNVDRRARSFDGGDYAWIAERLKEDGWQVSKIAGLLHMKVESLEKQIASRVVRINEKAAQVMKIGRSHREIGGRHVGFLKAPLRAVHGRRATAAALESQHPVSSHDVMSILDSMVSILSAGVVDMRNEKIAARVTSIREMLRRI